MPQADSRRRHAEANLGGKYPHQTSALYRLLVARKMEYSDLAKATGLEVRTLHNVASGGNKSRRARRKIEAVLGLRIWPEADGAPQQPSPQAEQ